MIGVEAAQPMVMLQPMWITVAVQLLTLLLAAGISYGMTRAKLSTNEKDIVALKRDMARIQADFQKWQRERLPTVVTGVDCEKMQSTCRQSICRKVDNLSVMLDTYTHAAHANWQNTALFIGAVCGKLNIDPPELK